jgi:hypothetical protein
VYINVQEGKVSDLVIIIIIIIIIVVFQGLRLLACSGSEFIFLKLESIGQLVGLHGQISPMQSFCLQQDRTAQYRKTWTHPCLNWDLNP